VHTHDTTVVAYWTTCRFTFTPQGHTTTLQPAAGASPTGRATPFTRDTRTHCATVTFPTLYTTWLPLVLTHLLYAAVALDCTVAPLRIAPARARTRFTAPTLCRTHTCVTFTCSFYRYRWFTYAHATHWFATLPGYAPRACLSVAHVDLPRRTPFTCYLRAHSRYRISRCYLYHCRLPFCGYGLPPSLHYAPHAAPRTPVPRFTGRCRIPLVAAHILPLPTTTCPATHTATITLERLIHFWTLYGPTTHVPVLRATTIAACYAPLPDQFSAHTACRLHAVPLPFAAVHWLCTHTPFAVWVYVTFLHTFHTYTLPCLHAVLRLHAHAVRAVPAITRCGLRYACVYRRMVLHIYCLPPHRATRCAYTHRALWVPHTPLRLPVHYTLRALYAAPHYLPTTVYYACPRLPAPAVLPLLPRVYLHPLRAAYYHTTLFCALPVSPRFTVLFTVQFCWFCHRRGSALPQTSFYCAHGCTGLPAGSSSRLPDTCRGCRHTAACLRRARTSPVALMVPPHSRRVPGTLHAALHAATAHCCGSTRAVHTHAHTAGSHALRDWLPHTPYVHRTSPLCSTAHHRYIALHLYLDLLDVANHAPACYRGSPPLRTLHAHVAMQVARHTYGPATRALLLYAAGLRHTHTQVPTYRPPYLRLPPPYGSPHLPHAFVRARTRSALRGYDTLSAYTRRYRCLPHGSYTHLPAFTLPHRGSPTHTLHRAFATPHRFCGSYLRTVLPGSDAHCGLSSAYTRTTTTAHLPPARCHTCSGAAALPLPLYTHHTPAVRCHLPPAYLVYVLLRAYRTGHVYRAFAACITAALFTWFAFARTTPRISYCTRLLPFAYCALHTAAFYTYATHAATTAVLLLPPLLPHAAVAHCTRVCTHAHTARATRCRVSRCHGSPSPHAHLGSSLRTTLLHCHTTLPTLLPRYPFLRFAVGYHYHLPALHYTTAVCVHAAVGSHRAHTRTPLPTHLPVTAGSGVLTRSVPGLLPVTHNAPTPHATCRCYRGSPPVATCYLPGSAYHLPPRYGRYLYATCRRRTHLLPPAPHRCVAVYHCGSHRYARVAHRHAACHRCLPHGYGSPPCRFLPFTTPGLPQLHARTFYARTRRTPPCCARMCTFTPVATPLHTFAHLFTVTCRSPAAHTRASRATPWFCCRTLLLTRSLVPHTPPYRTLNCLYLHHHGSGLRRTPCRTPHTVTTVHTPALPFTPYAFVYRTHACHFTPHRCTPHLFTHTFDHTYCGYRFLPPLLPVTHTVRILAAPHVGGVTGTRHGSGSLFATILLRTTQTRCVPLLHAPPLLQLLLPTVRTLPHLVYCTRLRTPLPHACLLPPHCHSVLRLRTATTYAVATRVAAPTVAHTAPPPHHIYRVRFAPYRAYAHAFLACLRARTHTLHYMPHLWFHRLRLPHTLRSCAFARIPCLLPRLRRTHTSPRYAFCRLGLHHAQFASLPHADHYCLCYGCNGPTYARLGFVAALPCAKHHWVAAHWCRVCAHCLYCCLTRVSPFTLPHTPRLRIHCRTTTTVAVTLPGYYAFTYGLRFLPVRTRTVLRTAVHTHGYGFTAHAHPRAARIHTAATHHTVHHTVTLYRFCHGCHAGYWFPYLPSRLHGWCDTHLPLPVTATTARTPHTTTFWVTTALRAHIYLYLRFYAIPHRRPAHTHCLVTLVHCCVSAATAATFRTAYGCLLHCRTAARLRAYRTTSSWITGSALPELLHIHAVCRLRVALRSCGCCGLRILRCTCVVYTHARATSPGLRLRRCRTPAAHTTAWLPHTHISARTAHLHWFSPCAATRGYAHTHTAVLPFTARTPRTHTRGFAYAPHTVQTPGRPHGLRRRALPACYAFLPAAVRASYGAMISLPSRTTRGAFCGSLLRRAPHCAHAATHAYTRGLRARVLPMRRATTAHTACGGLCRCHLPPAPLRYRSCRRPTFAAPRVLLPLPLLPATHGHHPTTCPYLLPAPRRTPACAHAPLLPHC